MSQWTNPKFVWPAIGLAITALGVVGAPLVAGLATEPPRPDCAKVRLTIVEAYDKHPEAVEPYAADSDEQRFCRVNEFQLKLRPQKVLVPAPPKQLPAPNPTP